MNGAYPSDGGMSLKYDVFRPQTEDLLPSVVCIHGGGWVSGDKSDVFQIAQAFVARGFAAFCPQYRLAPLYPFPAAVEDCRAFLRYLRGNARELHILPEKVGAFGNSAGGHLAAMLAMSPKESERANSAVDISGLTDLTDPTKNHPQISWDFIGQFLGEPYEHTSPRWIEASPIYQIIPETAPILIIHGDEDDVVWPIQSERFYARLREEGIKSEFIILKNEGHGFSEEGFNEIMKLSTSFFERTMPTGVAK
jgi:acetyl esterase/lipase